MHIFLAQGRAGPVFAISDAGPGIAPDQRSAVLQRFYRAPQTQDRVGAGLGLSIVAAIVGLHGFALEMGDAAPGACITVALWPHTMA